MSEETKRDNLYAKPMSKVSDFVFDEKVAHAFEDMIGRSVPGYRDIVAMIGVLAERYTTSNSHCYDLGCSLGAVTLAMMERIDAFGVRIISVDSSEAMIAKCQKNIAKQKSKVMVETLCEDIRNIEVDEASFVVLNFTLQFLNLDERQGVLSHIYEGMKPGGALIISEKIKFESSEEQDFQIDLHHTFKKLHGYSDLEISQKRTALETVLIPEDLKTHQKRLAAVGFKKSFVWFQCFNFASLIAFK